MNLPLYLKQQQQKSGKRVETIGSNNMTFCKMQNNGDSKKISG